MKKIDVYALGNALVDVEYQVSEAQLQTLGIDKGVMTLIDQTELAQLKNKLGHTVSHHRQSGGSAANSLISIAQLGGQAYLSCRVADDDMGRFYLQDLKLAGVQHNQDTSAQDKPTGQCLVMVTPDADRTMNTCLGVAADLSVEQIDQTALATARYLYLEGYLVTGESSFAALQQAIKIARQHETRTALTLSDPNIVNFFKPQLVTLIESGLDIVFANQDEAMAYTDTDSPEQAGQQLAQCCPHVVITRGAEPTIVIEQGKVTHHPVQSVEPLDTLGAGDSFAGGYLYGLTQSYTITQAARLASLLAGKLVTRFGPRLDSKTTCQILQDFNAG